MTDPRDGPMPPGPGDGSRCGMPLAVPKIVAAAVVLIVIVLAVYWFKS